MSTPEVPEEPASTGAVTKMAKRATKKAFN